MTFTYDEVEYTLPDELADITLEEHVEWNTTYGAELAARRLEAMKEPDELRRDLELHLILIDEAVHAISHYTTIPLEDVQDNIEVGQVLAAYIATQLVIAQEATTVDVQDSYNWGGHVWVIYAPDISMDDDLEFEDFKAVKNLAEAVLKLADGDWSQMYAICAAYFRHESEPFDREYIVPGHARYELMKTLPMDMALAVAQFIQSTLSIFTQMISDHYYDEVPSEVPPAPEVPDPLEDIPPPEA